VPGTVLHLVLAVLESCAAGAGVGQASWACLMLLLPLQREQCLGEHGVQVEVDRHLLAGSCLHEGCWA